jgi:hypothetical protein
MIANDSNGGADSAKEVIQAGKDLAPLFAFGETQPIAAEPKPIIAKKAQPGSEPLKNERHERFCQLVAYGDGEGGAYSFYEAYQEAFKKGTISTMTTSSARANASRLRRDHPEIDARIAFLDRELKEEVMLRRGSVFAKTINQVQGVVEAMARQKSNPKAASVLVSAAGLILKATGNEAPEQKTETTIAIAQQDGLGTLKAALAKVVRTST